MLITRIHWIFWLGWSVGSLFFVFSVFLSGLAGLVGCGFVLLALIFPFWVPFCILSVYFLEPFGSSFSIYLLFIDKKKKKVSFSTHWDLNLEPPTNLLISLPLESSIKESSGMRIP